MACRLQHRTTSLAVGLDEPQHLRRSTAAAALRYTDGSAQRTAATTAHLGITDHQNSNSKWINKGGIVSRSKISILVDETDRDLLKRQSVKALEMGI